MIVWRSLFSVIFSFCLVATASASVDAETFQTVLQACEGKEEHVHAEEVELLEDDWRRITQQEAIPYLAEVMSIINADAESPPDTLRDWTTELASAATWERSRFFLLDDKDAFLWIVRLQQHDIGCRFMAKMNPRTDIVLSSVHTCRAWRPVASSNLSTTRAEQAMEAWSCVDSRIWGTRELEKLQHSFWRFHQNRQTENSDQQSDVRTVMLINYDVPRSE